MTYGIVASFLREECNFKKFQMEPSSVFRHMLNFHGVPDIFVYQFYYRNDRERNRTITRICVPQQTRNQQ